MESITIDGMDEHDFRHAIEDMLRFDQVEAAAERLRALLAPYVGGYLPSRFLDVSAEKIEFAGWDRLAKRLADYDRENYPISAIGIALADARALGGPGPANGKLAPFLKTFYFSDDAYPFTNATRDDLLDGYTREGFGWQGDFQATDATLAVRGLDDLHGAIVELEDKLFDAPNPPEDAFRAGAIGACYLAVLIHQALRDAIRKNGLPRPLCVLAACDGVYPFFDAPVAGSDESDPAVVEGVDVWPNELEDAQLLQDEPNMFAPHVHRAKTPVLVLDAQTAAEGLRFTQDAGTDRMAVTNDLTLRGLFHGIPAAELVIEEWPEPEPDLPEPEPEEPEPEEPEHLYIYPTAGHIIAPTGRSIRARIHPPRADAPAPRPAPLKRLAAWLTRLIRGR